MTLLTANINLFDAYSVRKLLVICGKVFEN